MTSGPRSQCDTCARFRSYTERADGNWRGRSFCAAFPESADGGGIPKMVLRNRLDHRQPIDGDHGLRWESNGEEFPADGFRPERLGVPGHLN
jgi:hypothetical protein